MTGTEPGGVRVEPLPVARLRRDEAYQPRLKGVSEGRVQQLLAMDPADWTPPGRELLVAPNGDGTFTVLDGNHRHEAAARLGLPALPCRVDPDAGYPEAVAANLAHGLPLSVADKRTYARWLAEHEPGLSYREIGRRCGLNHETVKRALEHADETGEDRQRPAPDPIGRLVGQVHRAYAAGHGRTWLGFGRAGNPRAFRREIEAYREDDRAEIAAALDAFGRACVAAAEPYLPND